MEEWEERGMEYFNMYVRRHKHISVCTSARVHVRVFARILCACDPARLAWMSAWMCLHAYSVDVIRIMHIMRMSSTPCMRACSHIWMCINTHARARTRTHTHTHTHTLTHTHGARLALMSRLPARTHARTHAHAHTRVRSESPYIAVHLDTHSLLSLSLSAHTHTHTHTHTHARTHARGARRALMSRLPSLEVSSRRNQCS